MESIRIGSNSVGALPVVVLALLITSCGGGSETLVAPASSGGAGGQTVIRTGLEGAQAAAATVDTAYGIAPLGVKLADIAATANAELAAVPVTFIPVTLSCSTRLPIIGGSTSTPDSATVLRDPSTGTVSATFNACRSGARQADGYATVVQAGGVSRFTLGSASGPLTVTEYAAPGSATVNAVYKASGTVSYGNAVPSESLTVNGSVETWDYVRHTHDSYRLDNAAITVVAAATTVGADPYNRYAMTFNGRASRTAYVSDSDPAVRYDETNGFTGFGVVYRTPAPGSAAVDDYVAVGGDFSIGTVPAGRCIDGAFTVATVSDIRIARSGGMTAGGQLRINASASATFNADGSVSVALDGGGPASTYTQTELLTLCAL